MGGWGSKGGIRRSGRIGVSVGHGRLGERPDAASRPVGRRLDRSDQLNPPPGQGAVPAQGQPPGQLGPEFSDRRR
jgi:hypothetical protein